MQNYDIYKDEDQQAFEEFMRFHYDEIARAKNGERLFAPKQKTLNRNDKSQLTMSEEDIVRLPSDGQFKSMAYEEAKKVLEGVIQHAAKRQADRPKPVHSTEPQQSRLETQHPSPPQSTPFIDVPVKPTPPAEMQPAVESPKTEGLTFEEFEARLEQTEKGPIPFSDIDMSQLKEGIPLDELKEAEFTLDNLEEGIPLDELKPDGLEPISEVTKKRLQEQPRAIINDLSTDSIQAYTQYRLDRDPKVLATEVYRDLVRQFGEEAKGSLLTIRQYLKNPHQLSAPSESLLSGGSSLLSGVGQTLGGGAKLIADATHLDDLIEGINRNFGVTMLKPGEDLGYLLAEGKDRARATNQEVVNRLGSVLGMAVAPEALTAEFPLLANTALIASEEMGQGATMGEAVRNGLIGGGVAKVISLFTKPLLSLRTDMSRLNYSNLPRSVKNQFRTIARTYGKGKADLEETAEDMFDEAKRYLQLVSKNSRLKASPLNPTVGELGQTGARMQAPLKQVKKAAKQLGAKEKVLGEGVNRSFIDMEDSLIDVRPYQYQIDNYSLVHYKAMADRLKQAIERARELSNKGISSKALIAEMPTEFRRLFAKRGLEGAQEVLSDLKILGRFRDLPLAEAILKNKAIKRIIPEGGAQGPEAVEQAAKKWVGDIKEQSSSSKLDKALEAAQYIPKYGLLVRVWKAMRNQTNEVVADQAFRLLLKDIATGRVDARLFADPKNLQERIQDWIEAAFMGSKS